MFKICQKLSYEFETLMSSWGWGNIIFEITIFTWLFKYLGPNLSFFYLFFCAFFHFDEKFKNLFYHAKLKKVGVTVFFVFYPFFYLKMLPPPPPSPTTRNLKSPFWPFFVIYNFWGTFWLFRLIIWCIYFMNDNYFKHVLLTNKLFQSLLIDSYNLDSLKNLVWMGEERVWASQGFY